MGLSHPGLRSVECHRTSGWPGVSWSRFSALVSWGRIVGWSQSRTSAPAILLAKDRSAVMCSPSHAAGVSTGHGLARPHLHYYPLGPELRWFRRSSALVVRGHQPHWRQGVGPWA